MTALKCVCRGRELRVPGALLAELRIALAAQRVRAMAQADRPAQDRPRTRPARTGTGE